MEWHDCIKSIGEELCINKQELDTPSAERKGKHFLFIIAILCKGRLIVDHHGLVNNLTY